LKLSEDIQIDLPDSKKDLGDRNRREVVQHAQAFVYLCIDNASEPLTEEILKQAHAILMKDIVTREDGDSVSPGEYRKTYITAGGAVFPPPEAVPKRMKALCKDINEKVALEKDPYVLAARLAYRFCIIHPFDDGNGRMSRLLLNWVLLRSVESFPCTLGYGCLRNPRQKYLQSIQEDNQSPQHRGGYLATLLLESMRGQWHNWRAVVEEFIKEED